MAMTPQQHQDLTNLVTNAFSPDPLYQLVMFTLGVDMFVEFVGTSHPHRHTVFLLLDKLDEHGLVTALMKGAIKARPDNQSFQDAVKIAWPAVLDPDTPVDVSTVTLGVAGLVDLKQMPNFRALLRRSEESVQALYENISLLESYKDLHDCLHHLQLGTLRRLGTSARRLATDPESANDMAECIQTIETHITQIDAAIEGLPQHPPGMRQWEKNWLVRLETAANLASKSRNQALSIPGLQGAQILRRILRQEPPRIDRHLRITAESIDLVKLAALFLDASNFSLDPDQKAGFLAAKTVAEQLSIRLKALVSQHSHWQDIDAQLWDTDDYIPRTPIADTSDFEAFWTMLHSQLLALTSTAPSEIWAEQLIKTCGAIEAARIAGEWQKVAAFLADLRGNAIGRFFRIDTDLKLLTKEIGKIGDSLKQLL